MKIRQLSHYLLRATPDGEGNWFYESPRATADDLRRGHKRPWDDTFERVHERLLSARTLPLLVDTGGHPTRGQIERLFGQCSHAIWLASGEAEFGEWRALGERLHLHTVAEIESGLEGEDVVLDAGPPLRLRLCGLVRGKEVALPLSPAREQLIERVAATIALSAAEGWTQHAAQAPEGTTPQNVLAWLEKARPGNAGQWLPNDLESLLAALPATDGLAIYDARPAWLLAGIAVNRAGPLHTFDARYGWVRLPTLENAVGGTPLWRAAWVKSSQPPMLSIDLEHAHLEYREELSGPLPPPPARTVVLSGRLPNWFVAALARHYSAQGAHVGIYDPREHGAVMLNGPRLGETVALRRTGGARR